MRDLGSRWLQMEVQAIFNELPKQAPTIFSLFPHSAQVHGLFVPHSQSINAPTYAYN